MTPSLKTAVIGTGAISQEHLDFLSQSGLSQVVGVCDLSPAAARYAASRFKSAAPFTHHERMLTETRPDVVHILTPPRTHLPLATAALQAGAHVIVEKPLTPTREEFEQLFAVARTARRHVVEDHNYRFNEPVQAIEQLVADGELGTVCEVEVRLALALHAGGRYGDHNLPHPSHKLPAGVIHEFLPHLAYLALRFIPDAQRVAAAWSNHSGDPLFQYDDLDALVIAGDAHARLRFSCHTQPDCFMLTVRGTRGCAQTDLFHPHLQCVKPRKGGHQLTPLVNQFANGLELMGAAMTNLGRKVMQHTPYEGMRKLLKQTYDAILNNESPPVTFEDMDRTSRLIDRLLAEENRI